MLTKGELIDKTRNAWQSPAYSPPGIAILAKHKRTAPSKCRRNKPSADRCLLCTVKMHYLQKYWMEAHQIYMTNRRTVAALNAPIDISIVQRV